MRILTCVLAAVLALATACRTNATPEAQFNDAAIKTAVKAKLASELRPNTLTNVSVDVTNGVVSLAGQVSYPEDVRRAAEIARSVEHVVKVNNNLQVSKQ